MKPEQVKCVCFIKELSKLLLTYTCIFIREKQYKKPHHSMI